MIKADAGWVAQFEHHGVDEDVPIVAWSGEGKPLVVEWSTGNLVAPTELRDKGSFRRVVQRHVSAVVPGAGWRVRRTMQVNRQDQVDEFGVIGFEFRQGGDVTAAVVGANGVIARYAVGQASIEFVPPHRDAMAAL